MSASDIRSTDPVHNFEVLWQKFDENYGCFPQKNIDWNLVYKTYRQMVTSNTSEDELFAILTDVLAHLNDNHVKLAKVTMASGAITSIVDMRVRRR